MERRRHHLHPVSQTQTGNLHLLYKADGEVSAMFDIRSYMFIKKNNWTINYILFLAHYSYLFMGPTSGLYHESSNSRSTFSLIENI